MEKESLTPIRKPMRAAGKVLITAALCLCLMFALCAVASAAVPFNDVAEDAWYADAVQYVYDNGIMNGTGGGAFSPDMNVTRAQFVTMLWRLDGSPAPQADCTMFFDIDPQAYYLKALSWAYYKNIVNGMEPHAFGPNVSLTRQQFAAMFYRYIDSKGQGFNGEWTFLLDFEDADRVADWAYEGMCWMVMHGIINGMGNNLLAPDAGATRAQTAAMLQRLAAIDTDEGEGQNPVMNFVGKYGAGRATILVEAEGDENAKITVTWSSSAWEHAKWVMSGKFDPETLMVEYDNAKKSVVTYESEDEVSVTEVYKDGAGKFVFSEDGEALSLTWDDQVEHIADGTVFAYAVTPDE